MSVVLVTKMHGTHNDFVVLDQRKGKSLDLALFAKTVCDRRASVGADGLLVIAQSQRNDAQMIVFNADGSKAEMCGNGARCVARYLSESGAGDNPVLETAAGPVYTWIQSRDPFQVRVNMGSPKFGSVVLPHKDAVYVSLGNPHAVFFQTGLGDYDLAALAEQLNGGADWAAGINVHVAAKAGPHAIRVRHYERGVGATMACGTGAVASAAAAVRRGDVSSPVQVHVPGGELFVEWDGRGDAFLTGPAVRVFDTEIEVAAA